MKTNRKSNNGKSIRYYTFYQETAPEPKNELNLDVILFLIPENVRNIRRNTVIIIMCIMLLSTKSSNTK